jgi:acyl-CoA synthetase (AMP-forming)/AMP-acid ligase II
VAFYLMNSPDFIFAWLGLWSVGAAPAMINYNLKGTALMHCLGVSGAKFLLVDETKELSERIQEVEGKIGEDLGMRIRVVDASVKSEVKVQKTERHPDGLREGVRGDWPVAMYYTRYNHSLAYNPLLLIINSGTTGMPKGVAYNTDRAFANGAAVIPFLSFPS